MIGNILKQLRTDKGLTIAKAAEIFDVASRTYSSYELEEREPNLSLLQKFADYYNVSTDYLLGRTDVKAVNTLTEDEPTEEEIKELEAQIGEAYEKMSIETRRACVQVLMQIVGSVFWEDTEDEAEEETEDKAKAL